MGQNYLPVPELECVDRQWEDMWSHYTSSWSPHPAPSPRQRVSLGLTQAVNTQFQTKGSTDSGLYGVSSLQEKMPNAKGKVNA